MHQMSYHTSMEDVMHMNVAGVTENSLVWVDSSLRDSGGDESEYSVVLPEPLRNVVGIRVIEATIPATMLSVDTHNCSLNQYTLGYNVDLGVSPQNIIKCFVEAGGDIWTTESDYGKQLYTDSIQHVTHKIIYDIIVVLDARYSSLPGMDAPDTNDHKVALVSGDVSLMYPGRSVYDKSADLTIVSVPGIYVTDLPILDTCLLVYGEYSLPLGRYDSLTDFLSELTHSYSPSTSKGINLDFIQAYSPKPERSMRVYIDPSKVWFDADAVVEDGALQYNYTMLTGTKFCVVVCKSSTSLGVLGLKSNPFSVSIAGVEGIVSVLDNTYGYHTVIGRSLVNFSSERYVWLRCEEIEHHMCSGVGDVIQRGIGVFRLESPGVFKEEKTEYISTIPNEFHPISKLNKLTFRFDMGSRQDIKYDFKGIGHYMLISVKSIRADTSPLYSDVPHSLNPSYKSNFMAYYIQEEERKRLSNEDSRSLTLEDELKCVSAHVKGLRASSLNA